MTTPKYIDASTSQIIKWIGDGLCMWCGAKRSGEDSERFSCFCRRCPKCDRVWLAETKAFMPNGSSVVERCPECE
jgi:hypothetical protein